MIIIVAFEISQGKVTINKERKQRGSELQYRGTVVTHGE
jgi:hypothetical protein